MTWPELRLYAFTWSQASLKNDISQHMIAFLDWGIRLPSLSMSQARRLCSDELFTTFLASCIHPLFDQIKRVAELLSFFNEALYPDGYAFKQVSMECGQPIYGAYTFGSNDEEYIVPRAIEIIEQVALKFHLVIRKLSQRHDNRPPLKIRDEYDVQDLFYALLTPFFEDIRPEKCAQSCGRTWSIDFLIKSEQIVIEIKKTRLSLKVKELRDQLIVDKEIYRTHLTVEPSLLLFMILMAILITR